MTSRLSVPAVLAAALLLGSCALWSQPLAPQIESAQVDELSGLAVSHADPDLLWGHNDSGDVPRLFRIGPHGEDLSEVAVPGADAVDWEDIAAFDWQGRPALLVGDVGDNEALRDHVTLYALSDPGRLGPPRLLWRLDVHYPDGARDCEGIAVDPLDDAVILISKRDHPQHLYRVRLPATAPAPGSVVTAEALGLVTTLPRARFADLFEHPLYSQLDGPTALDIARDGRSAVVTTYKDAWRYRRAPGQGWAEAFATTPERIALPRLEQAEAGAISADGARLFVSGEGRHPPLLQVPLAR